MWKREDRGREEHRHRLTHPAVACSHSSSGTYASLDCLKERPAFPHHLNRPVPLLFHSLEGSPTKPTSLYPCFPPHFCLRLLIVSTCAEIKLSNSSFVSPSGSTPPHPSIAYHPPIPTSSPSQLIHSPWSDTPPTHCLNPYQHVK